MASTTAINSNGFAAIPKCPPSQTREPRESFETRPLSRSSRAAAEHRPHEAASGVAWSVQAESAPRPQRMSCPSGQKSCSSHCISQNDDCCGDGYCSNSCCLGGGKCGAGSCGGGGSGSLSAGGIAALIIIPLLIAIGAVLFCVMRHRRMQQRIRDEAAGPYAMATMLPNGQMARHRYGPPAYVTMHEITTTTRRGPRTNR